MNEKVESWAHGHKEILEFFKKLDVDDNPHNIFHAAHIYHTIGSVPALRGEILHFLFKVLGHNDPKIVAKLCEKVPGHILVKACSGSATYGKRLVGLAMVQWRFFRQLSRKCKNMTPAD